ncbi:hypothetical protein [Solimonas soli]|uniref:hypothetical protein n=1 Tax=Solimonas soli TaxID=413479 RepID=UPI000480EE05|nr:hypothetical protein [Solimonas soli]
MSILRYLATLRPPMLVLGCYLLWYLVTVLHHFDPSPRLWLNALGISVLIGSALVLSVGGAALRVAGPWAVARLYLMPFCVSSFSSLIKDRGFMLVLSPDAHERLQALAACAALLAVAAVARLTVREPAP